MIEEMWGAKCGDTAGMTEIGTIMIFECEKQPGGTHIIEDHFIEEVLDPETARALSDYGQRRRARRDVVRTRVHPPDPLPHEGPSSQGATHRRADCGRTGDIYEGEASSAASTT